MICGIDPGLSGGIAFFNCFKLDVYEMPVIPIVVGKFKRRIINLPELHAIISSQKKLDLCVIEKQAPLPNQGVTSTFKTGLGYGILLGIGTCFFNQILEVRPQTWKKDLGISANKDEARAKASELFPRYSHLWQRKKDDGLAEAALIAYWGKNYAKH